MGCQLIPVSMTLNGHNLPLSHYFMWCDYMPYVFQAYCCHKMHFTTSQCIKLHLQPRFKGGPQSLHCSPGYRATRMHSADYAMARRPSVCLSIRHMLVFYLNGYTYPESFFSPSGSPTILVFPNRTGWQYSKGDPLMGASNAWGVWKNHDFRSISHFISE